MVAALLNFVQVDIPGILVHVLPDLSVLFGKVGGKIHKHRVHEPGIHMLGSIGFHGGGAAADGTVAHVPLAGEVAAGILIAALVVAAHRPPILGGDALLEDHFLIDRFLIFFVRQVALVVHLAEHVQLAVAVPLRAVALLAFVLVNALGIGVEEGRVIGDADEAGALGGGQALQLLAEIFRRRALDAVAAPTQIDLIEVILHNEVFVVLLFKELSPENLHHLPLDGDALLLGQVLHQLLGDGGAAELLIAAEEHIQAGLHRGNPVHTLMLIEPLILNGHRRVNHGLGDLVQAGPLPVGGGVNLLELLNIAAVIHIINKGGTGQVIVVHGPVAGLPQNVVLEIVAQRTRKNGAADEQNQQHRRRRADGNLDEGKNPGAGGVQELDQPVRIPVLSGFFPSPVKKMVFCHRNTSVKQGPAPQKAWKSVRRIAMCIAIRIRL